MVVAVVIAVAVATSGVATIPTIAVVRERGVVRAEVPRYGARRDVRWAVGPIVLVAVVVHLELASWRLERDGVVRAVGLESPQADTAATITRVAEAADLGTVKEDSEV